MQASSSTLLIGLANFNSLSANLFELTSDKKYLDAAVAAADFLRSTMHGYGAILHTIRLSIGLDAKVNCSNLNLYPYSHVTGYAIWGLAVLESHTGSYTDL